MTRKQFVIEAGHFFSFRRVECTSLQTKKIGAGKKPESVSFSNQGLSPFYQEFLIKKPRKNVEFDEEIIGSWAFVGVGDGEGEQEARSECRGQT